MKTLKFLLLSLTFSPLAVTAAHMAPLTPSTPTDTGTSMRTIGQDHADKARGHMGQDDQGGNMPAHKGDSTYDKMHAANRAHMGEAARAAGVKHPGMATLGAPSTTAASTTTTATS